MAGNKKFGTFSGVFTPSILTILGVILYMRMGWVVGNAGLIGAIAIVVIAHIISVSTGLSVSSIATDKKVGAGGIYYILSRSMGIPIGGAIGLALYVGTAFSIALYLIGFAESFNGYFGLDTGINGLRISGSVALLVLTGIALISTSVALKTQFFILAAIVISLVSIFFGSGQFAPQTVAMVPATDSAPLEIVFAIFFPAVTGFTAGTAMSGNLKDPKKSIPVGTIGAIAVGFAVYVSLAVFLAYMVTSEMLRNDYNALLKIAYFAPAVVAGIWGATLSSALGGILGGPRILQAMSLDKVTPRIFGKGRGKENEPINALILVFLIAQTGILIGELDVIARVVSMFYLAAYGFINISFFLESWANPDFQPTFKISRWIGLVGFVACFGVMFKLDMIAMIASIVVIIGIHFWLQRKHIELEAGNVWNSVWEKIVAKGLNKLETKESKGGKWNPNIILFSGESEHRPYLLEFSKTISGRTGLVTNFNLIKRGHSDTPLTKTEQTIKDEAFEELGIFGRKIEVDDIYEGIENVATTFGFSGIDPNTVMMGWTKTAETLNEFAKMTQSLIKLDYNILFLDFNKKTKFGDKQTVDLWLKKTDSNNAEMMLNIARFIAQSPPWAKAKFRVVFVNNETTDNLLIRSEISKLIEKLRIKAEIKVISNNAEHKDFYRILELESSETDLVVMGIPEGDIEEHVEFVKQTDEIFKTIGTTLLVKASNKFNRLDFDFSYDKFPKAVEELKLSPLPSSEIEVVNEIVSGFDTHLSETTKELTGGALSSVSSLYLQFVNNAEKHILEALRESDPDDSALIIANRFKRSVKKIIQMSGSLTKRKLPSAHQLLEKGVYDYVSARNRFLDDAERKIRFELPESHPKSFSKKTGKIFWRSILSYYLKKKILTNTRNSLYYFGVRNFSLVNKLSEHLSHETHQLIENLATRKPDALSKYEQNILKLFDALREACVRLEQQALISLSTYERDTCIDLVNDIDDPDFNKRTRRLYRKLNKRDSLKNETEVSLFASNWYKNQESAHRQAEAGLDLLIAGLSIFRANERIQSYINNTVIKSQQSKIDLLSVAADHVLNDKLKPKPEELNQRSLDKLAEGIDYINFGNILDREEANILSISGSTPHSVELMSTGSFKSLLKNQDDGVEKITLNLADIQSYIIQTDYLTPLQTRKESLATVSNEIAEEIYYSATLISHVVESNEESGKPSEGRDIAKQVQSRIESCREKLSGISDSFSHEITTNLQNTISRLSIGAILESADSFAKTVRTPVIKTKVQDWVGEQQSGIAKSYGRIAGFLVQQKQEIDFRRFEVSDTQFLNKIEQVNHFVRSLSLEPEVKNELPFYLEKLSVAGSSGKANLQNKDENLRSVESALDRISNGVSGAIIVLGETLSGKSYFTESAARTFLKGDRVHINPPSKQNFDINDLHFAFQKSFNKRGTTKTILEQISKKTVLIFDDIERWWIKTPNGNTVINYLTKIIEDYGNKHYFFINSNIHSFQIIKRTTDLERQLLSTIVLSPATKSELKAVILDRYHIAGTKLWYKGKPLEEARKVDALFSEIYLQSNGKIGLALNSWGSNIEKDDDGRLAIRIPKPLRFPDIKNPQWIILLYHMEILNRLTPVQIEEIFGPDEMGWVQSTLREMEKAELIYKLFNKSYVLNTAAKHYVEAWLKELKILKQIN